MQTTIIKKMTALLLIVIMVCSLISGCSSSKPQPEETISRLQVAINKVDVDGILQCLDSKWADQIESLLTLTVGKKGLPMGMYLKFLKTVMPILPLISDGSIGSDKLPEIEFTVLNTDISDHVATVDLTGTLTWGKYEKSFDTTFEMVLENDVWVVSSIS